MLLITGANGQLGKAVIEQCLLQGIPFCPVTKSELDITCASSVTKLVSEQKFDCIINCAAYTAVDAAETDVANAYSVNAFGPWMLASTGVPILHVSTDYVFDGTAVSPYETNDLSRPLSVYGLTKRAGEVSLLEGQFSGVIIRTAWVYSKAAESRNFFNTISRLAAERDTLRVVSDQTGTPTRAKDLAQALLTLYKQGAHKQPMHVMHFTNAGQCSWYDFACEIVKTTGSSSAIVPITTAEYPTKAVRPAFSVLSLKSLEPYGIKPRSWLEALTDE